MRPAGRGGLGWLGGRSRRSYRVPFRFTLITSLLSFGCAAGIRARAAKQAGAWGVPWWKRTVARWEDLSTSGRGRCWPVMDPIDDAAQYATCDNPHAASLTISQFPHIRTKQGQQEQPEREAAGRRFSAFPPSERARGQRAASACGLSPSTDLHPSIAARGREDGPTE